MLNQEETQIAINKIVELIYQMYKKDLSAGNIGSSAYKSPRKKFKGNNDKNTLFNYTG
ncbi:MAG: hypothetical protein H8E13_06915 [Actinobacteria bacterium]|nr:hypothetical protein [Actinomycetota bacterium]